MGVYSKIKRLFTARTNQADKPSTESVPRNVNIKRVTTTWTRGDQTLKSTGLVGWGDKWFDFEQEMRRSTQELQFAANGWQRGEMVITAAFPDRKPRKAGQNATGQL